MHSQYVQYHHSHRTYNAQILKYKTVSQKSLSHYTSHVSESDSSKLKASETLPLQIYCALKRQHRKNLLILETLTTICWVADSCIDNLNCMKTQKEENSLEKLRFSHC